MELTQAGVELLPLIDKVVTATEELLCFKNSENEIQGTLRVALPETLVTYQMQPILKEFKEKAPNVKLALQVMNCYAIYDQMISGNIDIAIHYDVGKYPKNIITNPINTYPLILVSSPTLDESMSDFTSPNQRKTLCHIQNDPDALYLKILNQYLKDKNITLETEVEDTGPGIGEELIDKIFEPFFTTKQAGKGTGLGLSISYSILREWGAVIWAEAGRSKGARFVISFPLKEEKTSQRLP